jgi:hypothetical protein
VSPQSLLNPLKVLFGDGLNTMEFHFSCRKSDCRPNVRITWRALAEELGMSRIQAKRVYESLAAADGIHVPDCNNVVALKGFLDEGLLF